jgi:hypothetical protein
MAKSFVLKNVIFSQAYITAELHNKDISLKFWEISYKAWM